MDNLQVVKMANIQIFHSTIHVKIASSKKIVALPSMTFIKKWPSPIWDKKNSDHPPKYRGPPPLNNDRSLSQRFDEDFKLLQSTITDLVHRTKTAKVNQISRNTEQSRII